MPSSLELASAVLSTERFVLEPIVAAHARPLFAVLSDSALYDFIPEEPPATLEVLRALFERWEPRRSPAGDQVWLNYGVRERATDSYCGTLQATVVPASHAYLAYLIAPQFWGRGLATETCAALIRFVFGAFAVKRMLAHVDTRNARSIRLLERLGFHKVNTIVGADTFKGSISDEFVFELDKSTWANSLAR
jgi:[ribosomal protein S5]-alanine N-acetyltransferase